MSPEIYIQQQLEALRIAEPIVSHDSLLDTIYARVTSKKFRKYALAPGGDGLIRAAIQKRIEKNEPITFGFPFGAYKLWRFAEAPEADWAELFTLMYYTRWLRPICDIYKPGVHFVFCAQELLAERLNNLTKDETDAYAKSFIKCIDHVHMHSPDNFKFELRPLRSMFDEKAFNEALTKDAQKYFPDLEKITIPESELKTLEMNVRLTKEQAADPYWRESIYSLHEVFFKPGFFNNAEKFTRRTDTVCVFPFPIGGNSIAIGTTKRSVAKFWVGVGALNVQEHEHGEVVLPLSQTQESEKKSETPSFAHLGKNFKYIKVFE